MTEERIPDPWEIDSHVCKCGCLALPLATDTGGITYYCSICGHTFKVNWTFRDLAVGPREGLRWTSNESC